MCELDHRQEKSNILRMKMARCRAESGAGAASKESLRTANPVHDLCMTGHDKSNALQAKKGGLHSELAQCQIDKETVTATEMSFRQPGISVAAQLAPSEAKVGPLKDICASDMFEPLCCYMCTCSVGIVMVIARQQFIRGRQDHARDLQPTRRC